ncbi:Myb/SANT-like DNA-binding domain protein [Rhynchospora pubera]|uniref:Myb/SANT-like DNA-binding domain protein n=1 Tax=Rhynchospora pubera TaxID=906938 RepID=A0AAV8CK49_9POAL|nr:Myb/SANT-like DNA-binding domain protein [Rhynchospora pubera]
MEADDLFQEEHGINEKHHDELQASEKILDAGYFTWTKMMDKFLLEVLREQQLKGLKNDRSFQPEAYRVAVKALNTKFNMKITREKIVNRLKTLKENMHLVIQALGKSGLSWDETTKKVQAAPKENSKLKRIRDKEICNFELLCDIFGVDRAKGGISTTCKERLRQLGNDTITIDDVDRLQAENMVILDNMENPTSGAHHENANGVSPSTKSMKRSSKLGIKRKVQDLGTNNTDSKTPGNQMEEGLNRVTNSMSEIARALQVANENFIKSNSRIYSPEEILAELKKLGISGDGMLDAADLLMSDNKKAGLFFACPDELKGRWLLRNGFDI